MCPRSWRGECRTGGRVYIKARQAREKTSAAHFYALSSPSSLSLPRLSDTTHLLHSPCDYSLNIDIMFAKALVSILSLSLIVGAFPPKKATCSKGRTAGDARVSTLHARLPCVLLTVSMQCCVWFDVLDDIQENL